MIYRWATGCPSTWPRSFGSAWSSRPSPTRRSTRCSIILYYIILYHIILYHIILYYVRLHHLVARSCIDRSTLIYSHIFLVVCWWFSSCMDWYICIVWFHTRASIIYCGGPRSSWAATRPRMARMTRMPIWFNSYIIRKCKIVFICLFRLHRRILMGNLSSTDDSDD